MNRLRITTLLIALPFCCMLGCTIESDLGEIIQQGDTIIIEDDDEVTVIDGGQTDDSIEPVDDGEDAGTPIDGEGDDGSDGNADDDTVEPDPPISAERIAQKVEIQDAVSRGAVCADGTPGEYFIRPGNGDDIKKVIVFLPGSNLCRNVDDCQEKFEVRPDFMTIRPVDSPYHIEVGLFSMDEAINPFANWTAVFITPCTMDRFLGQRLASAETNGFYHTGDWLFKAVVADLMREEINPDYNLHESTQVLVVGSGYSGQAVLHNITYLRRRYPEQNWKFLLDSTLLPRADQSYFPDAWYTEQLSWYDYWNASVPEACSDSMSILHQESCLFAPESLLTIEDREDIFAVIQTNNRDLISNSEIVEDHIPELVSDFQEIFSELGCGMASSWEDGIRFNSDTGVFVQTVDGATLGEALSNWLSDPQDLGSCRFGDT